MDDASIKKLFKNRDERAVSELKMKYEKLCMYIAGNILSYENDRTIVSKAKTAIKEAI